MYSYQSLPPPKTILSAAASLTASALLFKTIATTLLPTDLTNYLSSSFYTLFHRLSAHLTVVIPDSDGLTPNHLFQAANLYLGTKLSPSTHRIKINKPENEHDLIITVDRNQHITDTFQNIICKWVLKTEQLEFVNSNSNTVRSEQKFFELSFRNTHKETVIKQYLPHVLKTAEHIKAQLKAVKLHTVDYSGTDYWSSVVLNHPATFETIAMDNEMKAWILEDVKLFVKRKDYYRRVGKAWKRGYLFYGPPGTGKSSLVAAMANYLKFDVYDLDLREVQCNSDLRRLLIGTKNRSIIVIEDIDCNVGVQSREGENEGPDKDDKITLSGLLNFIDGLWSSCGDERIIVFTTNHKERLDAALLRPGRMDVHVEMSYCTYDGFKILASTYLQVKEDEKLERFQVVKEALKKVKVTPAEIAGELMKGEDAEIVLQNLIRWLQLKDES
ncbi:putative AAA+ ATPase domain, ATPase, AAA-type, core, AAA-type ATPase domain-containing protein [Helianthus annuus]|nr:putative AAA+ ATPase domain, ATPase, AAA-type, core, AAA-type ATPase domain-containing protein [Helianthus annuus]